MFRIAAEFLREPACLGQWVRAERLPREFLPSLEDVGDGGSVEHHELDFTPHLGRIVTANNAHRPLKRLTVQPQFAVERHVWESLGEPSRSMIDVALPGQELFPLKVGSHAIQLLTEPPALEINVIFPSVGQQEWRHRRRGRGDRLRHWRD